MILQIYPATCPQNPRSKPKTIGTLACRTNRAVTLGDERFTDAHEYMAGRLIDNSPEFERRFLKRFGESVQEQFHEDWVTLSQRSEDVEKCHFIEEAFNAVFYRMPIYLHDHGIVSLSSGDLGDSWCSGEAGFYFCSRAEAHEAFKGSETVGADCLASFTAAVAEYSYFLRGETYSYRLLDNDGCIIKDDRAVFYGPNWRENGIARAAEGYPIELVQHMAYESRPALTVAEEERWAVAC